MRIAAIALALVAAVPAAAQDRLLTGTLTHADLETYRALPFDVPDGVRRVTVKLSYDKAERTIADLGVWDSERFRGWSGGRRDRFTIAASDATPGYLAGALPAGRWTLVLGVPNIRAGVRAAYRAEVYFDRGNTASASAAIADAPIRDTPGWYRGDLHMHDAHSDGSCAPASGAARIPCPLFRTVAAAQSAGLDFVAVTDHNTVSHFGDLRELQPYFDRMLLIPGTEITTFHGHANIFAPARFVDFRLATRVGIGALQDEIAAAGALMSVNHPARLTGEECTGCGWTWPATDWDKVTAIEAINGGTVTGPTAGPAFWHARLDEGHRLTGIAGSDNHDPDGAGGQSPIGRPTTVVHAANLSTPAILQGIRDGNVFIDVAGSRDRLLEVDASQGGKTVAMGGTLRRRGAIRLAVHVRGAAGATATVIGAGGRKLASRTIAGAEDRLVLSVDDGAAGGWLAVTIERDGRPLLIGNPIYLR